MALFNKKELGKGLFMNDNPVTIRDEVTATSTIDKSKLDMLAAQIDALKVPNINFSLSNTIQADLYKTLEPEAKPEEWIWVNGYKGTDKNMQCHGGFQYELGKRYDMPEDAMIKECVSGFHLCLDLADVTRTYYMIGSGNRFFRVRALVRKNDALDYAKSSMWGRSYDKLAAKSIEFTSELTPDEILAGFGVDEWPDEYKKMAIEVSIREAQNLMHTRELVELGYSEAFAGWIIKNGKYENAKIASSQPGLSMDMRVLMIMNM